MNWKFIRLVGKVISPSFPESPDVYVSPARIVEQEEAFESYLLVIWLRTLLQAGVTLGLVLVAFRVMITNDGPAAHQTLVAWVLGTVMALMMLVGLLSYQAANDATIALRRVIAHAKLMVEEEERENAERIGFLASLRAAE